MAKREGVLSFLALCVKCGARRAGALDSGYFRGEGR